MTPSRKILGMPLLHVNDKPKTHTCGCIGPQNGEPQCPCMMRGVQVVDGCYVRIEDLGPAPSEESLDLRRAIADRFRS